MIETFLYFLIDYRLLLCLIIFYLIYKLGKRKHNLHEKLGHKGPPPLPFIGNFIDLIKHGIYELDIINRDKYGKIYPFYFGNIPNSIVSDEELMKQILIKDSKYFTDRLDIGLNGKIADKMLLVLKGKDWERVRNLLSPTFTSGKLKKMSPLINDCINLLNKRLNEHPIEQPFNVKEVFGSLTMDVIARTMFGMHIDSQTNPNNPFIYHSKQLFKFSVFNPMFLIFLFFPSFKPIFRKFYPDWEFLGRETLEFFVNNLQKAIDERQKSPKEYNDFLTGMMKAHKEIEESDPEQLKNLDSKSLTHSEIIAQSILFLLAGYETTATTMTYVAYFLAKNPDAQQEVYDEIINEIGIDGEITYENTSNLHVMDAAINESMRICPSAPRIDRVCTNDVILLTSDNQKIHAKKDDIFSIPIYAIHMDPNLWPNPQVFDLHRFDTENKKNRSIYNFMPFGMGPRNCVGMRFALMELKMALANILRQFELVPCAETLETMKFKKSGFSGPIKPIILKIQKRV